MAGFTNPHLKSLLEELFADREFVAAFLRAPAGKLWHHNRIAGLIQHTAAVCRLCSILARMYPEVDRELLIAGAILHDIGKIEEFHYDTAIDYTDRGRLVGHIVIGAQRTAQRAAQISGFPPELLDSLLHLILSHQGEHGSPVLPATREAFLLHFADQIDAKMDALRRITGTMAAGEQWKFVKLLDRFLFLGSAGSEDVRSPEE